MTLPKPMLAPNGEPNLAALRYPIFASHKLDGVRFLIFDGRMYSRNMEPLHPAVTQYFQPVIELAQESGVCLDGEIWKPDTPFNTIVSWMAKEDKCPHLWLYVFDILSIDEWYDPKPWTLFRGRVDQYNEWCAEHDPDKRWIKPVVQYECGDGSYTYGYFIDKMVSVQDIVRFRFITETKIYTKKYTKADTIKLNTNASLGK